LVPDHGLVAVVKFGLSTDKRMMNRFVLALTRLDYLHKRLAQIAQIPTCSNDNGGTYSTVSMTVLGEGNYWQMGDLNAKNIFTNN
jgi:hypothetical protein